MLLKKKRSGRGRGLEPEPASPVGVGSPETELPSEVPAPADLSGQSGTVDRMRIKTREVSDSYFARSPLADKARSAGPSSTAHPVHERFPRSKVQEIRQIFRRREPSTPKLCHETAISQPRTSQAPSLQERTVKEDGISQQFPDFKTKNTYLHRQVDAPMGLSAQERTQGGREFVQEQGRKEAMRRLRS